MYTAYGDFVCNKQTIEKFVNIKIESDGLPEGTYKDTCTDCNLRKNKLYCRCETSDMSYRKLNASFDLNDIYNECPENSHIVNSGGYLYCELKPLPTLPQGPYKNNCSNCYTTYDKKVHCSCKKNNNKYNLTEKNISDCPNKTVNRSVCKNCMTNLNGNLQCY